MAAAGDLCMTPEGLATAIETLLHAADRLGLADVGIKLNDAVIALGREGFAPSAVEQLYAGATDLLSEP